MGGATDGGDAVNDVFATLIVTAENAPLARQLAAGLSSRGVGMFTAALGKDGVVTHYCTSGWMDSEVIGALANSLTLYAACQAAGAPVTKAMCDKLVAESDVSDEQPQTAFARLGIELVNTEV